MALGMAPAMGLHMWCVRGWLPASEGVNRDAPRSNQVECVWD